jgi:hypothetical protein
LRHDLLSFDRVIFQQPVEIVLEGGKASERTFYFEHAVLIVGIKHQEKRLAAVTGLASAPIDQDEIRQSHVIFPPSL